jgi:hypothetical protein
MKLKVHGTLPRTGLLAASGGFAGVEEHAPESSVIRDEAEGPWYPPANRATCCKRWFCWCGGTCSRELGDARRSRRFMVLPQTGLLAASGGFAGVEEDAPESLVMGDKAEGSWYSHKQGYLLQAVVLLVWRNMLPGAW